MGRLDFGKRSSMELPVEIGGNPKMERAHRIQNEVRAILIPPRLTLI